MIDHDAFQRVMLLLEQPEHPVCRVRAAMDHYPLKTHPGFRVPEGTPGTLNIAQLVQPVDARDYLWLCVRWQGLALEGTCRDAVLVHYSREPGTTIWGDALYVIEELTLVDIVTKDEARKQPLRGQTRMF